MANFNTNALAGFHAAPATVDVIWTRATALCRWLFSIAARLGLFLADHYTATALIYGTRLFCA